MFTGDIAKVTCPVIAVLGTDCAIGKRTTATILSQALNDHGLKTVMIGTGQTGLIQGARYGVALDAIPSQFCAGELEAMVISLFDFVVYSSWRLSRWRCFAACAWARDSLRFPGNGHANAGYGDKSHRDVRQDHGNWRYDKP
jgi:hypothetical protein